MLEFLWEHAYIFGTIFMATGGWLAGWGLHGFVTSQYENDHGELVTNGTAIGLAVVKVLFAIGLLFFGALLLLFA